MRTFLKAVGLCIVGLATLGWFGIGNPFDGKAAADCSQDKDQELQFLGCTKIIQLQSGGNLRAAYYNRGEIYRSQNDFPKALADFDAAIKSDPSNVANYVARATVYGRLGDQPRMRANLDEAKRLGADDKDYHYAQAVYSVNTGKFADARASATKALSLNRNDAAFLVLALACEGLKDWNCAIDAANSAFTIKNNPIYLLALANIYVKIADAENDQGRKAFFLTRAVSQLDSALKIDPAATGAQQQRDRIVAALKKAGRL